ncbi:MAG: metallophosphoesterase [Bacteroidota bacterium]
MDNTAGSDVNALTISCWVYIDPSETTERYLYWGSDGSGKLGFGMLVKGKELYMIKYVNNAPASRGHAIPAPTAAQIGTSWKYKFLGPATFEVGAGWYQVILVQAPYYTRLFVGNPPNSSTSDGKGKIGKYATDFAGSMTAHGKQSLDYFQRWGMGRPLSSTNYPVQRIDDFMIFDYDMIPAQAEALYRCQVDYTVSNCHSPTLSSPDLTFAFVADYGCKDGSYNRSGFGTYYSQVEGVADMVKSWSPDFILSGGDDTYGDKTDRGCATTIAENVGTYYGSYIGPSTSDNRFYPTPGNHDYTSPGGISAWESYFYNPTSPTNNSGNERYYKFTKGTTTGGDPLIEFFAVNSYKDEPDGIDSNSTQATWLKNNLAISTAKYKIVYTHYPPYASLNADQTDDSYIKMRKWPFKKWGADLVLSGDQHFYERNDHKGLTYVVCGVGGYPVLKYISPASQIVAGNRVRLEDEFGALKIDANEEVMRIQFYTVDWARYTSTVPTTSTLRDEFFLYPRNSSSIYLFTEKPSAAPKVDLKRKVEVTGSMTVYPNPTKGELIVRLREETAGKATLRLLDVTGKTLYLQPLVLDKGVQEIPLDLSGNGISKGIYFLQLVSPKSNREVRLVVQ